MMTDSNEPAQTYDSVNAICPYCGNGRYVEGEDYAPDGVEEECAACGGIYERHTEFDVTHYCTPQKPAKR